MFVVVLSLVACTTSSSRTIPEGNRYATGFRLVQDGSACVVTVFDPWHTDRVMATYRVEQPYRRLACNGCTHIGFLHELGALDCLVGVSDKSLVYTPLPDSVTDLGNSMSLDRERLLLTRADAVLLSTYAQSDANLSITQVQDAPVVYINEWMESSPLARAEWIRVIGALVGKLPQADSIFDEVCREYAAVRDSIRQSTDSSRPAILSGQDFRGTWYVPAGGTYMGQLFRDAGFAYRYAEDMRNTSIPLTTEQVLHEFVNADVWVGVQARSLDELRQMDDKHTWFKPYRTGSVYHFMKRTTPAGANDFWETGVVHPELILRDLSRISLFPAQSAQPAQSASLYFMFQL
ncbi:MAG: ABC transporter substrate-binding protein [Paludibacteraceae bacterium]|nr:ABC transporter substrate-binding protein [Paludibacteraceae bacterium]